MPLDIGLANAFSENRRRVAYERLLLDLIEGDPGWVDLSRFAQMWNLTPAEAAEASIPFNYGPTTSRLRIEEDWAVRLPLACTPAGYLAQVRGTEERLSPGARRAFAGAAPDDVLAQRGVALHDPAGDEDAGLDPVAVEQVEDARHAGPGAVGAHRHVQRPLRESGIPMDPRGLAVEVERAVLEPDRLGYPAEHAAAGTLLLELLARRRHQLVQDAALVPRVVGIAPL